MDSQEQKTYTRLSNLVDSTFKVESVEGWKFKKWDNDQRKMLVSDTWQEGYRKIHTLVTDKGTLDLSQGQMGNLFEAASKGATSDLTNKTFSVKSNGKQGMDIRYYINLARTEPNTEPASEEEVQYPDGY